MKNVIDCLEERGFIDQMSSADLRNHLQTPRIFYWGVDPTADSLHLGNLVGLIAVEWLRRAGHTACILIGGATARIGDPSGKSSERPLLNEEELAANIRALKHFFEGFFHGKKPPLLVNNDDWYRSMSVIDFLRDVGKLFRVGPMLAKESVRLRLQSEEGLSFTEFSYQVLQGYDFGFLHREQNVTLQIGGSDQWGNITAGIEYNRKMGGETIYALTHPLLTRSDGKKFGKSEEGAIWLSEKKLSPYHFYQYLVQVPDADVIKLLRMLTFLEMKEIAEIEQQMGETGYLPNSAQKRLAEEVTRYVHGEAGLETALKVTDGMAPGADAVLNAAVLQELMRDMPHAELRSIDVIDCKAADLFAKMNLVSSKSESVRLIKNGGAYLNNKRIDDPLYAIASTDLIEGGYLLLSAGKKKRFLIRISK